MKNTTAHTLSFETAQARLLEQLSIAVGSEHLELQNALGRFLAQPIIAPFSMPRFTQSAMDGYALRSEDAINGIKNYTISGTSLAGHAFMGSVESGECVRIMTGAPMPNKADTVVPQENVQCDGSQMVCQTNIKVGANIRLKAEEFSAGTCLLETSVRLTPAHIGLLASIGITELEVFKQLKVALFTTGDELRPPQASLDFGTMYNSNGPALAACLSQLPIELVQHQHLADDVEQIKKELLAASQSAQLILTSGGVSVGDADYIHQILQHNGEVSFWKVAMKPGKPFAFGRINQAVMMALPGNPVSSLVTFQLLVKPALVQMAGGLPASPMHSTAITHEELQPNRTRLDFQRGIAFKDDQGELGVISSGNQSSGMYTPLCHANCLIRIAPANSPLPSGSKVPIQWLDW